MPYYPLHQLHQSCYTLCGRRLNYLLAPGTKPAPVGEDPSTPVTTVPTAFPDSPIARKSGYDHPLPEDLRGVFTRKF